MEKMETVRLVLYSRGNDRNHQKTALLIPKAPNAVGMTETTKCNMAVATESSPAVTRASPPASLPKSYNFLPLKYNFDDYVQFHPTNILNSNYQRNIIAVTIAYYFLTTQVQFCSAALAADSGQQRELQP